MIDVRARRAARDVALAVGGCALDLVAFSRILAGPGAFPPWVAGYAVAGYAALLWRRRAPRTVFAVLWLHAVVAVLVIPSYGPVVGVAVALFTIADRDLLPVATGALVASLVPTVGLAVGEARAAPPDLALAASAASLVVLSLVNALVWSLGRWARAHRAELVRAEQERRLVARQAVAADRVGIARELHDVISHSVGVMMLQAAGARTVLAAGRTERAERALADIEDAGSRAMVELRRMLDVLRTTYGDGPDDGDDGGRVRPSLRDIDELVDGMRAAGLPVRVVVSGEPGELRTGGDLTAYRVVQESLTNALKHAGAGTPTLVELRWEDGSLELSVVTSRPANPTLQRRQRGPAGTGYGLLGLRERAETTGARLTTETGPDGDFRVAATLPVEPADRRVPR